MKLFTNRWFDSFINEIGITLSEMSAVRIHHIPVFTLLASAATGTSVIFGCQVHLGGFL